MVGICFMFLLRLHCSAGADIQRVDADRRTPLHWLVVFVVALHHLLLDLVVPFLITPGLHLEDLIISACS